MAARRKTQPITRQEAEALSLSRHHGFTLDTADGKYPILAIRFSQGKDQFGEDELFTRVQFQGAKVKEDFIISGAAGLDAKEGGSVIVDGGEVSFV